MSAVTSLNTFLILMTVIYIGLVLYMRRGWFLIPYFRRTGEDVKTQVSVLIAARNEEENIGRTIEAILAQTYPQNLLEIIVVDDHSTDRTAAIIASYADRGVRLIQLNEGDKLNSYKKLAISRAISGATGELIVTTDADCRMGPEWLLTIVSYFERTGAYMVSSPVIYSEEKSYFERLQTLEFLYLIGLGAAGIGNGSPTTCNGANLAYRRDVFYEMGGFRGIDNVASGDDELFLHKVAERYADRIKFCKSIAAAVFTDAKPTVSAFISQRKRWASKSTKYKDKRVVWLGISIWAFNLALVSAAVLFFVYLPDVHWLFAAALALKIFAEYLFIRPLCRFAGRMELLWNLPLLSFAHAVYLVYIGVAGNVGKYDWKGRKVH
ncbi:cellulose synthase/poly-beta-1,6-N-acetylglucosamine synthase-like glycosyltransferase [Sphingobacterium allocomposti]|uniref:Cellulose synthase/poly-beta-1,6-N-acetylglucosamine synthase-like glycosyltransferase n=1 Tax=Sphingobacterium allocomposti TaxID=415956 RepID=A0A5S5D919_9SPHI|nr:glycosyltransferase [Sphingobacterium composti Yoo et al. 2007 non Ten et al. 2007]TYP91526.1 cellulose synthase/poly-beta-1,6-N-acetylglucosamine synthase-like glycosyltransferase [Sphingobacterium composti Yoo et al. 2007 non Ten et al. 2007]